MIRVTEAGNIIIITFIVEIASADSAVLYMIKNSVGLAMTKIPPVETRGNN